MRCVLLAVVLWSVADAALWATSRTGTIFSVKMAASATVVPAIQLPVQDISGMTARAFDGAGVAVSSQPFQLTSFNLQTLFTGISANLSVASSPIGPFYDIVHDRFFLLVNDAYPSSFMRVLEIDARTLKTTQIANVTYAAGLTGIVSPDSMWAFVAKDRVVCGTSHGVGISCIDVDTWTVTVQHLLKADTVCSATADQTALVCVMYIDLNPNNGCIDNTTGLASISQYNTRSSGSRLIASISNPSPFVCPLSLAFFADSTSTFSAVFSYGGFDANPQPSGFRLTTGAFLTSNLDHSTALTIISFFSQP